MIDVYEEEDRIFMRRIYWVFAENLMACITDSPKNGNPMGNSIRTSNKLGDRKIGDFGFRQASQVLSV